SLGPKGLGRVSCPQRRGRSEDEVTGGPPALPGNPAGAGNVTSGGTESIIMGLRAAKEARRAAGTLPAEPQVVVPASAHPAFEKACALMDMTLVRTALRPGTTADPAAVAAAVTGRP